MPLIGQTIVVSGANTYVANDQLTAINLATTFAPGNKATVIPRYPVWPTINRYVNDNGLFSSVSPEYIWDSSTTDNQVRAFAVLSGGAPVTLSVTMADFADNAHVARIDVYNLSDPSRVFVETITPPVLVDRSMDANTSLVETFPYNWQDIRIYNSTSNLLPGTGIYAILVSFTAVNYLGTTPPITPGNPAGIMFYAHATYST